MTQYNGTSFLILLTSVIIINNNLFKSFFYVSLLIVFTLTFFYTNGYQTLAFFRHQHFNTETKQAKRSYRQEASIRRKHASKGCQATLDSYYLWNRIVSSVMKKFDQNGEKPQTIIMLPCVEIQKYSNLNVNCVYKYLFTYIEIMYD